MAKGALRPGCHSGAASTRGKWEKRSRGCGYLVSHPTKGDCGATSGVWPAFVADGLPEHVEAAAPLPLTGSLAAAVGEQPEPCCWLQPLGQILRSRLGPLRRVDPMGEGIRVSVLFLYATSGNFDALMIGVPRRGLGCR